METKMTTKILTAAALGLAFAVALAAPHADAREGRVKARGEHGAVAAGAGPNGGAFARGAGAKQNADGSVTAASGGVARGPNGAKAARASTTTVNPDGSASRRGGFAASGANGAIASTGSTTRNADGTVDAQRTTEATGAKGSYEGQTTYNSTTGVTRQTTCTDPSGAVVACPR
jgi:hypothetical protein